MILFRDRFLPNLSSPLPDPEYLRRWPDGESVGTTVMASAPEPQMRACLAVLYYAAIEARLLGNEGAEVGLAANRSAQLADLMDAIHNIPRLLLTWEDCDESLLLGMLKDYDRSWSPIMNLGQLYDEVVAQAAG